MQDKIEKIGKGSVIQHGSLNKRVYLMKLKEEDSPFIISQLNNLARKYGYTKLFCKVPDWAAPLFYANGFILEAQIPKCYGNKNDAFLVSKFLNSDRLLEIETEQLYEFSKMLLDAGILNKNLDRSSGFVVKSLGENESEQIAEIYREVFLTYPFPIHNPAYIENSMNEDVQYFGIEIKGKLVALASAEVDKSDLNAEVTDFATLPKARGKNLSVHLLQTIEEEMKKQGIKTLYTIARLNSIGMNKTFLKMGYTYSGTLIKNTNISGNIESMNVFYKHI